jgi:CDP-glycerol glycerophosphotransferase
MRGKERLNTWTLRDYVKNTLMLLVKIPIRTVQLFLFWIPVHKNRITVYSLKQHGYSCNLKYLTEYLKQEMPEKFELMWIVKRQEDLLQLQQEGVPAAMALSLRHFLWRHRSGIVITNDEFYPMCRKRRGQQYINLWHGGINYKKIGYEGLEFTNPVQKLIYRTNNPKPDCFVSGSRSFTQTAAKAFGFPERIFLECGLPRNDILIRGAEKTELEEIRRQLGIAPGKKVVLYAPTFRGGGTGPQDMPDYRQLAACLGERFGGEWVILLRQHYFVAARESQTEELVRDVSDYPDMQQLLLIADCLISDYSSCMWDYLLTGGPCFVYAKDLKTYQDSDRSFFISPQEWPYPVATDEQTLWKRIREFDADDYQKKTAFHRQQYGSRDTGTGCEQVVQYMQRYLQ